MDLEDGTALASGTIFLFQWLNFGARCRPDIDEKLILHIIEYEKYVPHHMIIFL
jgi:hypothetical protein